MNIIRDLVKGALHVNQLTDRLSFGDWEEFLEALPDLLSVEVPSAVAGVLVQQGEPDVDSRQKLWLRIDSSGSPIGLYAFQKGKWQKFQNYDREDIIWKWGDSLIDLPGYKVILLGDTLVPPDVVQELVSEYIPNPPGVGYKKFAVRWVGY